MVDEKVDEKSEKEDNNLSIRYGKLKDKHSSAASANWQRAWRWRMGNSARDLNIRC